MYPMADDRAALRGRLAEVLGEPHTTTLMRLLPSDEGADLVSTKDLALVLTKMDERFEKMDQRFEKIDERFDRLSLDFHTALLEQTRSFVLASTGSTVTMLLGFSGLFVAMLQLSG